MAKKKNNSRKQGWFSKLTNAALVTLGFSRVLGILFTGASIQDKFAQIQREATFGLSEGKFDLTSGLLMYSPAGAAFGLGMLKRHLMKLFPVR